MYEGIHWSNQCLDLSVNYFSQLLAISYFFLFVEIVHNTIRHMNILVFPRTVSTPADLIGSEAMLEES